jgi:hypothetical protein
MVRQVRKEPDNYQERLKPGQKIWEMVAVPDTHGEPVQGMDPQTGQFDPELALVRPAKIETSATALNTFKQGLGEIEPGVHYKVRAIQGNFYEVAINARNARRKIIAKYFPNT